MRRHLWVSQQCFECNVERLQETPDGWVVKTADRRYFRFSAAGADLLQAIMRTTTLNDSDPSHERALHLLRTILLPMGIYRPTSAADTASRRVSAGVLRWHCELIPQRLVARAASALSRLFAPWTMAAVLPAAIAVNVAYGWRSWDAITYHDLISYAPGELLAVLLLSLLRMAVHEFGHAAACYRYTRSAGPIGFGIFFFAPVLYCDVSDIHLMPRMQKAVVGAAGTVFELLLLCVLVVIWGEEPAVLKMYWLSLLGLLLNMLPLYRSDGYWIVSDLAGSTNLLSASLAAMRRGEPRLADILLLGLTGAASVVLTALALRFAFVVGPRQWVEAGAAASAFAGSVLVAITMLQYLVLALTLWMLLRALRRSWATRRTE
jgi:hypothetical protein